MIETERLILRPYSPNDWRDLFECLSSEDAVKFEPYGIFTEEECRREAENRSKDGNYTAVCLKENGKLIGNIYFARQAYDNWELGYVFNPAYQRKGYASEAARAAVSDAILNRGARRIEAKCNPLNEPSWRLLERIGLRREGHRIKNIYFKRDAKGNPVWADTFIYGILADELLTNNQ